MGDKILITLDVKNEGIPHIRASYILTNNEWIPIKCFLEKDDLEIILNDEECSSEKVIIDRNTLQIEENRNPEHIKAFQTLYKNHFFTYDLLMFIKGEMEKPCSKLVDDIFEMGDENEQLDYYLMTKKNTPEFSCLDDERIKAIIMETKKTVNLFKNN